MFSDGRQIADIGEMVERRDPMRTKDFKATALSGRGCRLRKIQTGAQRNRRAGAAANGRERRLGSNSLAKRERVPGEGATSIPDVK